MRIKNMIFALFALLLAACSTSSGGGSAAGDSTASIPVPSALVLQEDLVEQVGDRIFFAFDSSALGADSQATLDRLAIWMRSNPTAAILIEGHADERGTREYNLALGARRANAAYNYLVASGINPNRLGTISYGEERPAVLGSNELAWAQNRRDVFVVQ